ncbi:MAG: hypothetical protein ACOC1V_03125 [Candidatus Saliniplasma sp.]
MGSTGSESIGYHSLDTVITELFTRKIQKTSIIARTLLVLSCIYDINDIIVPKEANTNSMPSSNEPNAIFIDNTLRLSNER